MPKTDIARRVHGLAKLLERELSKIGVRQLNDQYFDTLRLRVSPDAAESIRRLSIEAGSHKVEIRAEGFETVTFDVMVTPGETVTYKGTLKPITK